MCLALYGHFDNPDHNHTKKHHVHLLLPPSWFFSLLSVPKQSPASGPLHLHFPLYGSCSQASWSWRLSGVSAPIHLLTKASPDQLVSSAPPLVTLVHLHFIIFMTLLRS